MSHTLEIHHIDVKGGDATAIIVKDQNTQQIQSQVLIDAGAEGSGANRLIAYLTQRKIPTDKFDYIIGSHYHNDHIDGFRKANIIAQNFIDIGGYTINQDSFMPENGTGVAGQVKYFEAYKQHLRDNNMTRVKIPFIERGFNGNPTPLEIELVQQSGIKLICYGGNGILANGTNVLSAQKPNKNRAFDPNDHSLIFVLEWEGFRYFTAGDLSGDVALQSYYNIEEMLADYLFGKNGPLENKTINVVKVNHHGSEFSNYPPANNKKSFLERLNPETLIIPVNQNKGVPSVSFLMQALTYSKNNNATMSFVNDFFYAPGNNRYPNITSIVNEQNIMANIQFSQDDNGTAILGETVSIIIRRHSGGAPDNSKTSKSDQIINKTGYRVIVKKESLPNVKRTVPKFSAFFLNPIDEDLETDIRNGFKMQSNKIENWLMQDQTSNDPEPEGAEYLELYFPSLAEVIENNNTPNTLNSELEMEMNDLFDRNFILKSDIKLFVPLTQNDLTLEEKATLYWLLIKNINQQNYNLRRDSTVRFIPEPYQSAIPAKQTGQLKFEKRIKIEQQ